MYLFMYAYIHLPVKYCVNVGMRELLLGFESLLMRADITKDYKIFVVLHLINK